MHNKHLIYVIEDEVDLGRLIQTSLSKFFFEVQYFAKGQEALAAISQQKPDICIIDLNLPDMDGIDLVRKLQHKQIGIVIVSGRDALTDRVLGLELGADDYVTKPFEPRELVARVQSLQRRMQLSIEQYSQKPHSAHFAGITFHPDSLTLNADTDQEEKLSRAEADMLLALLKHPYQILSRDQLLGENTVPYDRSIDVRVSRLRKKIQPKGQKQSLIQTVYGAGYMLVTDVEWK
ncbi:response regulator transcription factor [Maribrevibacterium harenarium]|uniref:Response regulator transcription factor n=1 Tax=Maribrevibacterium harenarium TaxID=2589817 RepID=A0A501WM83_9GAMM|nr:response regulator transcription factor [Maribrevibacterium harenarium]TPE48111.1 response regulator transcription factor [Maribrevibacterium harenarium]